MLLVILIAADVAAAVAPSEGSVALHFVVDPLSIVDAAVSPPVLALTMDVVLAEVAVVSALVRPNELSTTVLHALLVLAIVLGAIRPLFHAESVLLVSVPLAFVPAAVVVGVNSVSIGLVLSPLSFVDIALRVDKPSIPVRHAVAPKPVIPGPIWPYLDSTPIFLLTSGSGQPLALIDRSVLENANRFDLPLSIVDLLDGPVEGLQLIDDVHHALVVVLRLEDLELLVLELLEHALALQLFLVLARGSWFASWDLALGGGVLICGIATNSHL